MKITSADNICWIAIQINDEAGGHPGFEVVTHVDIGHGQFEARNLNVYFFNSEEFLGEIDKFIIDRNCAPRLNGAHDTYIGFSKSGNAVVCEYRLGDAYSSRKTARFYQSGGFEIEQERLLEFCRGFRELLAQQRR